MWKHERYVTHPARHSMDNLPKSGPEKRDSTVVGDKTENVFLMFSETHKLRRKNWARQDTRGSVTTLRCVAMQGASAWSRRALTLFFLWSSGGELCRAISPEKLSLGPSDEGFMINEQPVWESYFFAFLYMIRIVGKYFKEPKGLDSQGDQDKLPPKDLQVNPSLWYLRMILHTGNKILDEKSSRKSTRMTDTQEM